MPGSSTRGNQGPTSVLQNHSSLEEATFKKPADHGDALMTEDTTDAETASRKDVDNLTSLGVVKNGLGWLQRVANLALSTTASNAVGISGQSWNDGALSRFSNKTGEANLLYLPFCPESSSVRSLKAEDHTCTELPCLQRHQGSHCLWWNMKNVWEDKSLRGEQGLPGVDSAVKSGEAVKRRFLGGNELPPDGNLGRTAFHCANLELAPYCKFHNDDGVEIYGRPGVGARWFGPLRAGIKDKVAASTVNYIQRGDVIEHRSTDHARSLHLPRPGCVSVPGAAADFLCACDGSSLKYEPAPCWRDSLLFNESMVAADSKSIDPQAAAGATEQEDIQPNTILVEKTAVVDVEVKIEKGMVVLLYNDSKGSEQATLKIPTRDSWVTTQQAEGAAADWMQASLEFFVSVVTAIYGVMAVLGKNQATSVAISMNGERLGIYSSAAYESYKGIELKERPKAIPSKATFSWGGPLTREAMEMAGNGALLRLPVVAALLPPIDKFLYGETVEGCYAVTMDTMFFYDYGIRDVPEFAAELDNTEELAMRYFSTTQGDSGDVENMAVRGYCSRTSYAGINYKRGLEDMLKMAGKEVPGVSWIWHNMNDTADFAVFDAGGAVLGPDVMAADEHRIAMFLSRTMNDYVDLGFDLSCGELANTIPTVARGDLSVAGLTRAYTCFCAGVNYMFAKGAMTGGPLTVMGTGMWQLASGRHRPFELAAVGRGTVTEFVPPHWQSSGGRCFIDGNCDCHIRERVTFAMEDFKVPTNVMPVKMTRRLINALATCDGKDAALRDLAYGWCWLAQHSRLGDDGKLDAECASLYDRACAAATIINAGASTKRGEILWLIVLEVYVIHGLGLMAAVGGRCLLQKRLLGDERSVYGNEARPWAANQS